MLDTRIITMSKQISKKKGKAFPRSPEEISQGILASVEAVRSIVNAIAEKRIPVVLPIVRLDKLRYAPHFAVGVGKDEPGTVPYTLPVVAKLIGATYARK